MNLTQLLALLLGALLVTVWRWAKDTRGSKRIPIPLQGAHRPKANPRHPQDQDAENMLARLRRFCDLMAACGEAVRLNRQRTRPSRTADSPNRRRTR